MTDKNNIRLAIFAEGEIGFRAVEFVATKHPQHLKQVVLAKNSKIVERITALGVKREDLLFSDEIYGDAALERMRGLELDHLLLAWWPFIIKEPLISLPSRGVLNFHPSYLPYNRGKGYSFWTIVEDTPFGVTIHYVNEGIDAGDIAFQRRIDKSWEDNGGTLYYKAQDAMIDLFKSVYPRIVAGDIPRLPQEVDKGSFHYGKELDPASRIDLDKQYTARELLNLLRARTFSGYPACRFEDEGRVYEARIEIKELK